MAITDLKGTTWYVPSGWTATAGYGIFEIDFDTDSEYGTLTSQTSIEIGRMAIGAVEDKIQIEPYGREYTPSMYFTLTITGGTDVTNSKLIQWLTTYGTQLTIDDLTDTAWYIPEGWEATAGYGSFSVNGTYGGVKLIGIGIGHDGEEAGEPASNVINCNAVNYHPDDALVLTFTGGTDVKNPALIAWLSTYGTQLKVTDLTNTTWTVNAGWEAEAGYGEFNVDYITKEGEGEPDTSCKKFLIGYDYNEYDDYYTTSNNVVCVTNDYRCFSDSSSYQFSLTFTGGTDIKNPALIAWFSKYSELQETYTISGKWEFHTIDSELTEKVFYQTVDFVAFYGEYNLAFSVIQMTDYPKLLFDDIVIWNDYVWNYLSVVVDFGSTPQVVSKDFYDWITTNTIKQEETPTITDLTGYTVTVPAGWSVTAGYGLFNIHANITNTNPDVLDFNYVLGLGYAYFDDYDWSATSANIISVGSSIMIRPSTSFTIEFLGGTDVSKPDLIQWLVDNNAIFTKEGEEETPDTPETPTSQGEIYYKGELVATLVEGETIVLHTKDFKFLGDIVIKNVGEVEEEEPTLISFTIDGTTYQAEEGMTWGDWVVDSQYNTGNFAVQSTGWISNDNGIQHVTDYSSLLPVSSSTEIVANEIYSNRHLGGGV